MTLLAIFQGQIVYDEAFSQSFDLSTLNMSLVADLCRLCRAIGSNAELVRANTSQCLPSNPGRHAENMALKWLSLATNALYSAISFFSFVNVIHAIVMFLQHTLKLHFQ